MKKKIAVEKCVYATPVEARPDQKNLVMWVRLGDLPLDLTLDPNARRANVKSKVAKQIAETLRTEPENFWKFNQGIQMTARDFEVKNGRVVVLDLFDPEDDAEIADGVINGGHSYEVIKLVLAEVADDAQRRSAVESAVVRVEVLTGIDRNEMPDISRARNTGAEVKKHSLQNLKNLYEPIKRELGPVECERVGFCENDVDPIPGKTYQVIDLIRLMSLFNNRLYPVAENKHPVQVYTSAMRIVERWETEWESYQPLVPNLRLLMVLHDRAYVMLSEWTGKKRGPDRNGFDDKPVTLPFTGKHSEHKVSAAFVYPLLSGLRLLLDDDCNWKTDPQQFLRDAGPSLVSVLMTFYDEHCKSKPHECGRAVGSWRAVAAEARAKYAEGLVAHMKAAATA